MFDEMFFGVIVNKLLFAPRTNKFKNTEVISSSSVKIFDVVFKWLAASFLRAQLWLILIITTLTK